MIKKVYIRSPYKFCAKLGCDRNTSIDDIKKKYKELLLQYHPDLHQDEELRKKYSEKTREIIEAYEVLSDPSLRIKYFEFVDLVREVNSLLKQLYNAIERHYEFLDRHKINSYLEELQSIISDINNSLQTHEFTRDLYVDVMFFLSKLKAEVSEDIRDIENVQHYIQTPHYANDHVYHLGYQNEEDYYVLEEAKQIIKKYEIIWSIIGFIIGALVVGISVIVTVPIGYFIGKSIGESKVMEIYGREVLLKIKNMR